MKNSGHSMIKHIQIQTTDEELEEWKKKADKYGMSLSAYIRFLVEADTGKKPNVELKEKRRRRFPKAGY